MRANFADRVQQVRSDAERLRYALDDQFVVEHPGADLRGVYYGKRTG